MADQNEGFPEEVKSQQEAIRRSGAINMFDKAGVRRLAEEEFGFDELAEWIAEHGAEEYIEMAEAAAEEHRPDTACRNSLGPEGDGS